MFKYSTPSNIDDLAGRPTRTAFLDDWHASMKKSFDDEISNLPAGHKLFFTETASPATSGDLPITWNAFPLSISRRVTTNATARWNAADQLSSVDRGVTVSVAMPCRLQDEYCEWYAYRQSPGGPITRIVFTAEAPEYWIMLAKHDFNAVVTLYKNLVSPNVQPAELKLAQDIQFGGEVLTAGSYNPYNKWNTSAGVVHLTHPANTLGAEINLAARATIPRSDNTGARVTEVRRLACASNFGDPNRSSDPNIGHGVNMTVLPAAPGATAQSVTLANPVALYIDNIANGAITDLANTPLSGWFRIIRGVPGRGLMAVLEPPAGSAIGLDQIKVGGRALTHGGQVADRIQMVLYGKTANLGQPLPALIQNNSHCCRPDTTVPVDRINLQHTDVSSTCTGRDAYPELDSAGLVVAMSAEAGDAPLALTRSSGSTLLP